MTHAPLLIAQFFPVYANLLTQEGLTPSSQTQLVSDQNNAIKGNFYDRLDSLMDRTVFRSETPWFSQTIEAVMQLILDSVLDVSHISKYLQILKRITANNPDFVSLFWENPTQKGYHQVLNLLLKEYPRSSVHLTKMARLLVHSEYNDHILALLSDVPTQFQSLSAWTELFKEWVVFLKQLINHSPDQSITIRLPILKFVKLICTMIVQQPNHFLDIESYLLNFPHSRGKGGYVLTLLLLDSLVFFQRLKNPPFSLLALIIDALSAAFQRKFLQKIVAQVFQMYPLTL